MQNSTISLTVSKKKNPPRWWENAVLVDDALKMRTYFGRKKNAGDKRLRWGRESGRSSTNQSRMIIVVT